MMLEEYAPPPKTGYPNQYIAQSTTSQVGAQLQANQEQVYQTKNLLANHNHRPTTAPSKRYAHTQRSNLAKHIAIQPPELVDISHFQAPASTSSFSMKVAPGHQAYEPPVPKHLIPTNNPFYNK